MVSRALPDDVYNARWIARITSRCVRTESGCLVWQGQLTYNGYAQDQYRGKTRTLHRVMFQLANDVTLTRDIDVCHHCDVRNCIEPGHLWAGTRKDNMQDCSKKGRADGQWKTHCLRGHPLSGDNLYIGNTTPYRHCKACQRIRSRIKAGWTVEEAESAELVKPGYTRHGIPVTKALERKSHRR